MHKNLIELAEAYYSAITKKNHAGMEQLLHPQVTFRSPLAELTGRPAVLEAAKNFGQATQSLTVRSKFGSGDQAMLVFDVVFPAPVGKFPAASLLTFKDGLIASIELFLDSRAVMVKKEEIFS
jgi:ketosteroid isomerase-like protein